MATLAATAPKPLAFLPELREEIALHPGPTALDGSPTWTLHDPARNQFYRLGWREFEMLSRWDSGSPANLIARLRRETTIEVEQEDIEDLAKFLSLHSLLASRSPDGTRVATINYMNGPGGGNQGTDLARIWDAASGKLLLTLGKHRDPGNVAYMGGGSGVTKKLDRATMQPIPDLNGVRRLAACRQRAFPIIAQFHAIRLRNARAS